MKGLSRMAMMLGDYFWGRNIPKLTRSEGATLEKESKANLGEMTAPHSRYLKKNKPCKYSQVWVV